MSDDLTRLQAKQALRLLLDVNPTSGVLVNHLPNAVLLLSMDPDFKGLLVHNSFRSTTMLTRSPPGSVEQPGPYPRPMTDEDVGAILVHMHALQMSKMSREMLAIAITYVAGGTRFHPVCDWLDSLRWDGVPRLDRWLNIVFGAEDSLGYNTKIGRTFLAAAVRRVRQPGIKFDYVLVLEGDQGIGKSLCCRSLFSTEWFTDSLPPDWRGKEAPHALLGVWGVELADLEQLARNESEVIKAFLSRQEDRFRKPYGHGFITQPRQMVFIGTTNVDDYNKDTTGGRRFWPVKCTRADHEWLTVNRDQLWAEASAKEPSERLWMDDEELEAYAKEQMKLRTPADLWHDRIAGAIFGRTTITVDELLEPDVIGVPINERTKRDADRVRSILRLEGWETTLRWSPARKAMWRLWVKK